MTIGLTKKPDLIKASSICNRTSFFFPVLTVIFYSNILFADARDISFGCWNFFISTNPIAENPFAEFWTIQIAEPSEGYESQFKQWNDLVESFSAQREPRPSGVKRVYGQLLKYVTGQKYDAQVVLGPAIRSGIRPVWLGEQQFKQVKDITDNLLLLVADGLHNEGQFQIRDATVRIEPKGVPIYHATWHKDPGYVRAIVLLDGSGTFVWPSNFVRPIQIQKGQALLYSGFDREKVIPRVKAIMHSSPIADLPLAPNPWTVPLKYWWQGKVFDAIDDRVLLVVDIDLVGERLHMMPREDNVYLN